MHVARDFDDEPIDPYWLVVAATDDRAVNERVARAADAARRFCNVVDDAELCSFIMPAIVDRSPVTIAIGTSGHSPVLARWVKGLIEAGCRAGSARSRSWPAGGASECASVSRRHERRHFWERVVSGAVAEHAFAGRDKEAEEALEAELTAWGSDEVAKAARLISSAPALAART